MDDRLGAQLTEILHEVEDEAVVAVDHQHPRRHRRNDTDCTPSSIRVFPADSAHPSVSCGACRPETLRRPQTLGWASRRLAARGSTKAQDRRANDPVGNSADRHHPHDDGDAGGHGDGAAHHYESGRYTAPIPKAQKESPPWVPALMLGLLVVGALLIMLRYLVWDDTNVPMVLGMACLLGGLYTGTKWR